MNDVVLAVLSKVKYFSLVLICHVTYLILLLLSATFTFVALCTPFAKGRLGNFEDEESVGGNGKCVLKCEAKGYSPSYCVEKCRNTDCIVNCEAQGHNPRYCGEICTDDDRR